MLHRLSVRPGTRGLVVANGNAVPHGPRHAINLWHANFGMELPIPCLVGLVQPFPHRRHHLPQPICTKLTSGLAQQFLGLGLGSQLLPGRSFPFRQVQLITSLDSRCSEQVAKANVQTAKILLNAEYTTTPGYK